MTHLLKVENLKTYFNTYRGTVKAVDGVSFEINESEIIGIVGESGCGKSATMLSIMQLIPAPPGKIVNGKAILEGENILEYEAKGPTMTSIRGSKIAMVFQEPMTSLNPVLTVSRQLTEGMELHLNISSKQAKKRAVDLLAQVEIPDAKTRIDDYPHQFSGGMRQRVMIAMGLSCNPKILIADEPTTALDVTTQAQLLELMKKQVSRLKTALIIVTHNLGVVARYAERIYVMYSGRLVESGPSNKIFNNPCHPYTMGLLQCVPRLGETHCKRKLVPIKGIPPDLIDMPATCAFLPRCPYSTKKCKMNPWPDLRKVSKDHFISCYVDI